MIFNHIVVVILVATTLNLGIVLCEDVQPIEKSVQLLQLHLCRDECYKKVIQLTCMFSRICIFDNENPIKVMP